MALKEGCRPGKGCLSCPHPDCILGSTSRVFPEETEMLKVADLPQKSKKRTVDATNGPSDKRDVKQMKNEAKNKTHSTIYYTIKVPVLQGLSGN